MAEPVYVLGCGAIGTAVTARLLLAGVAVVSVDEWDPHVEALATGAVQVDAPGLEGVKVPAHDSLTFTQWEHASPPAKLCVLACKSVASQRYLAVLEQCLDPTGVVASFQNGFNEPEIALVLGQARTAGAIVLMDAALDGPARLRQHRSDQRAIVGPWEEPAEAAARELVEACNPGLPIVWSSTIQDQLAAKLVRNCVMNAVCSLADLAVGEMTGSDELLDVALLLGMEAARVLEASGYEPDAELMFGLNLEELTSPRVPTAAMRSAVRRTHPPGFSAVPSTLQDLRLGRQTEIDHISGWVAATAQRLGVDAALTARAVEFVHAVEEGRLARGAEGRGAIVDAARSLGGLEP